MICLSSAGSPRWPQVGWSGEMWTGGSPSHTAKQGSVSTGTTRQHQTLPHSTQHTTNHSRSSTHFRSRHLHVYDPAPARGCSTLLKRERRVKEGLLQCGTLTDAESAMPEAGYRRVRANPSPPAPSAGRKTFECSMIHGVSCVA